MRQVDIRGGERRAPWIISVQRGGAEIKIMRKLFTASALALLASSGFASAATINSTTVTIWDGATPGANSGSASQQGLPTATGLFGGPLPLILGSAPLGAAINYNDTAGNSIPGFFASDTPAATTPATCVGACLTNPLSTGGFAFATVFRFTFTAPGVEFFSVIHDDGVSLFLAGTEDLTNSKDLLPLSAASPTTAETHTVFIGPGTYDLWYAEVNGLPAVLEATALAVPEPSTWAMMLLGFVGLGFAFRQSRRKVSFV
jgi:hypothetical protein